MPTLFAMSGYLVWAYAYINIYIPSLFSFYSTDFRFPPSLQAYCGNPRNWTLTFCCSLFLIAVSVLLEIRCKSRRYVRGYEIYYLNQPIYVICMFVSL